MSNCWYVQYTQLKIKGVFMLWYNLVIVETGMFFLFSLVN